MLDTQISQSKLPSSLAVFSIFPLSGTALAVGVSPNQRHCFLAIAAFLAIASLSFSSGCGVSKATPAVGETVLALAELEIDAGVVFRNPSSHLCIPPSCFGLPSSNEIELMRCSRECLKASIVPCSYRSTVADGMLFEFDTDGAWQDRTPQQSMQLADMSLKLNLSTFHPAVQSSRSTRDVSCGPACLQYLIRDGGWANWASELPSPPCPRPRGWSMQDLVNSAKGMRWKASCVHTDWDSLRQLLTSDMTSAVLHVNSNHFILVCSNPAVGLVIFDPRMGVETAVTSLGRVYDWDGYAVIVRSAAIESDSAVSSQGEE